MKKLLLLLALFCSIVPKISADVIQPSTTPYDPEHVYTMKNAKNWYADANTHGTQTEAEYGHFAFYQATNTDGSNIENAYYIFCVESQQWLTYTKASSYNNGKNFITMSSSLGQDDYFYLNQRETGFYDIAPYNTSGVASKYLNWYEGANEDHTTIGLWEQNLSNDEGSKFTFTKYNYGTEATPYYTITSSGRGSWMVNESTMKLYGTKEESKGGTDVFDNTNAFHQFAFIKKGNNTYLYNLGAKKYILKTGEVANDPTDPIFFVNTSGTIVAEDAKTNGSFCIMFDTSHFINLGGNCQIVIDGWGPGGSTADSKADGGNTLTLAELGTYYPELEDHSETLAPNFGIDAEGVRINAYHGTLSEENYGYYHKWESEKTAKVWTHEESVDTYTETPLVAIEAFRDTYTFNDKGYKFSNPIDPNKIELTLSNMLSSLKISAGSDYKIVGYTLTYTTPQAITDINSYEGEITCPAAGTYTVEVKNLDTKVTEIAFGNGYDSSTFTNTSISISSFYVFVRKGESLTTDYLAYLTEEPFMTFNKAYTIASKGNPNNHLYAPEGKDMLDICGQGCKKNSSVTVTATDPNQQFMLIPFSVIGSVQTDYEDCFFLYNVGQRMFVSKEGNFTLLTKYPRNAVEITAGEGNYEGYFRLSFNKTNLLNVSTGHCDENEENSSCVVTNWNTIDNGNNFYIREVRDFREEDGTENEVIMGKVFNIEDETKVSEMTAKLNELLQHNGVGYPISTVLRENLETIRDNINYPSSFFDFEYHTNAYKTTTEVNMPVSGNAYRIYARYANGDKRYLYRTEGGKLRMSNAGEEPTGHAGTFILRSTDTAENSYLFAHDSGEYMVYVAHEKQGVGDSGTGFVSAYEQGDYDADVKLISTANKTATNSSTTTTAGDFFGGFLLQARNTTDNNDFYMMGGDGTDESSINLHDGEASSIYYNDTRSSIFYVEETSYPNVANMRCAAYNSDGKSYASIWLPFDIEIPEGVEAYTARIDEVNSRLVLDLVEGDYLPAECAAILIGSTEEKTTLIPAKVKADAISSNQLKGTNVAGQAPATDKKTFVLNGAKTKGIGFYPYTAANLPTYKAYIEMDAEMAAQGLRFSFATPTGIEETIVEGEREAKVYYDLSGRRVAQPTKGLYIVNGKKMYIK